MVDATVKIALVTGAASGLGFAIAERLAQDGFHTIAVDRDSDVVSVAETWQANGLSVEAQVLDLADTDAIGKLIMWVENNHGRLDVLVNNAGISPKIDGKRADSETMPLAQWHEVLAINLTAPFHLSRLAMPLMRKNGWGRIINIASRAGRTYVKTAGAHYTATKAGLIGLSRMMAGEFAAHGITVNTIAPGRIETPLSEQGSAEMLAALKAEIPVGRAGKPDEVGATVSFLVGPSSGFITGAVLDINGGVTMV
ncbi:MAG: SDR family NAD(P)-dependent oxidoreductase [Pelagibacterium sp.]|uniref:SDR family NAD(P)-dependent oxidoreductase n=1 Tax=Pelagibacterium sp. TaxID=1967288 RepID=UPI0032EDEB11